MLGFFEFSKKKALTKIIKEMTSRIKQAEACLKLAEDTYNKEMRELDILCKEEEERIRKKVESMHPISPKPLPRFFEKSSSKGTEYMKQNDIIMRAIFEKMIPGQKYTLTQLRESVPEYNLTSQRITALISIMLNHLGEDGFERTETGGCAYFMRLI